MIPRNRRIINLTGIEENMRLLRSVTPSTAKMLAVVKADGYGHGAAETAEAAIRGGADMIAVASVGEGKKLREKGILVPILVLGAVTETDVAEGVVNNLTQTVCSPDMVRWCEQAASEAGKQTEVHLKIDTGMGRIGVRTESERDEVLTVLKQCSHVKLSGTFTHFSDADGDEDGKQFTREQFQRFLMLTEPFRKDVIRHCCNSAAIHRFPEMSLDMVRAGISLYGYPPVQTTLPLIHCMKWCADISYIKEIPQGSYISYGRTFISSRPFRTATITCGYGDGYFRSAGEKGYVLIHGKRAKILGRVCMDQMIVDISDIEDVSVGEEAILIGRDGDEEINAEEIASWAGTISYEILLSVGSRVDRIFLK